jgi:threonine dehydratase
MDERLDLPRELARARSGNRRLIEPYVRVTPVIAVPGSHVDVACARHVQTRAAPGRRLVQSRGAFTHLLTREIPAAGVVAASGGNHGAAVAYAAMRLGVPAKIFVPAVSSPAKIARIRAHGRSWSCRASGTDALAASEVWAENSGAIRVHAFDQIETLVGQATLGLELAEQAPDVDTVLVGVGGADSSAASPPGMRGWRASSASSLKARRR